jgi:hypothetical protein
MDIRYTLMPASSQQTRVPQRKHPSYTQKYLKPPKTLKKLPKTQLLMKIADKNGFFLVL